MGSTTLKESARRGIFAGRSPLLRLQSDDRLVALVRDGNVAAFENLFERYRSRLLAFCRHMLRSQEDAEDVLQEVFASAYNAMRADDRKIQVRPWLYRISRNRCLNHLRRPVHEGQDTIDARSDGNGTTDDRVQNRAVFRNLVADVGELPESQRSALLLREIDDLSYDQIADAMETTIPSIKSLLVRARVSLAEAAEAREMTCDEVRIELGEVAEGLKKTTPPVRRHVRQCEQCAKFKSKLKRTTRDMHALFPASTLILFKNVIAAKLAALTGGGAATGGGATVGGGAVAGGGTAIGGSAAAGIGAAAGGAALGGATAGSVATGVGGAAIGTKIAATAAAAAIATAGVAGVTNNSPTADQHAVKQTKSKVAQVKVSSATVTTAAPQVEVSEATVQPAPPEVPQTPVQPAESQVPPAGDTAPAPADENDDKKVAEEKGEAELDNEPAEETAEPIPPAEGTGKGTATPPETTPAPPPQGGPSPPPPDPPAEGDGDGGAAPESDPGSESDPDTPPAE